MACEIVNIGTVGDCIAAEGGLSHSYVTKLSNITAVTVAAGVITGFTMASTGAWKKWSYDTDGTSSYAQPGALNNNVFSTNQEAFVKVKGIDAASVDAANKVKQCCDVVAIHVMNNGTRLVQGLEYMEASGAPIKTKKGNTRVVPSVLTDTSANESRSEYRIQGVASSFSNTTTLTDTAIAAL